MSAHTLLQQQTGLLSGRQMTMLVTVGLHALVIAALMAMRVSLDAKVPDFLAPIDLPSEDRTVVQKPQPLTVNDRDLQPSITQVPIVALDVIIPPETSSEVASLSPADSSPVPADAAGPGSAGIAQIPSTALQYRAVRPADDYYPSQSLSLQEEGTAIVRVCVAPSGKLDGKPVIDSSSGSARLDTAALTWAREALRFTPATQGGVPVGACKGFRVNFTLH